MAWRAKEHPVVVAIILPSFPSHHFQITITNNSANRIHSMHAILSGCSDDRTVVAEAQTMMMSCGLMVAEQEGHIIEYF